MAEIINLRRARKQRTRDEKERQAAVARTAFGRSKAERASDRAAKRRLERHLDGHRRDDADSPGDPDADGPW